MDFFPCSPPDGAPGLMTSDLAGASKGDGSEGFTHLPVGFQTEGHLVSEGEGGGPGWTHDVQDGLESVRCLVTCGRWGCSHSKQVYPQSHLSVSCTEEIPSCTGTLGESRMACFRRRLGYIQGSAEGWASGKEAGRTRPFQGLALSLGAHDFFSPQLWFVYFDLENCVQFLSEHVREMKTSQEVRCLK